MAMEVLQMIPTGRCSPYRYDTDIAFRIMKDGAIDVDGYDVPVSYGRPYFCWLRSPSTFNAVGSAHCVESDGVVNDGGSVVNSYGRLLVASLSER